MLSGASQVHVSLVWAGKFKLCWSKAAEMLVKMHNRHLAHLFSWSSRGFEMQVVGSRQSDLMTLDVTCGMRV